MSKTHFLVCPIVAVSCLACERAAPSKDPAPAVAPVIRDAAIDARDVDADVVDDANIPSDEDCENTGSEALWLRGVHGTVTLQVCQTGESWDSEPARDEGFIWKDMEARIAWIPDDENAEPETWVWKEWSNGWESGWYPTLAGVLVAPLTRESVLVIRGAGHSPAGGWKGQAQQVDVLRLRADGWERIERWGTTAVEVTIAPDRKTATIESCSPAEDPATAPGCMGVEDASPDRTIELRFDGTKIIDRDVTAKTASSKLSGSK